MCSAEGEPQTAPTTRVRKEVDLLDAVRVGSVPAGLWVSLLTQSPWCIVAVVLYNVAGGPVHEFLTTVLNAAAERWAYRIRSRAGSDPPSPGS
jgi:hypothetical protein